jgi:DNA-binding transcriptional MocR family regulator
VRRDALVQAAAHHSVGVYPIGYAHMEVRAVHDDLVLGYANLAESAIDEGIRWLARALEELPPVPAATNDGGAMSR